LSFHIGPHAPIIQPPDVQLVHRLWLNLRKTQDMPDLHHSDIITYALTRMAAEVARDREGTLRDLRQSIAEANSHQRLGTSHFHGLLPNDPGCLVEKLDAEVTAESGRLTSLEDSQKGK
jgi:hypothetical protein